MTLFTILRSCKKMLTKIFKYSSYDLVLVCLAIIQFTYNIFWLTHYKTFSPGLNFLAFLACSYFIHYNVRTISHNHVHCPFFKNEKFNELFALANTSNIFLPFTFFRIHHLVHHRYSNDTNKEGKAKDTSSTYLHGKNERQEPIITYALLSYGRQIGEMVRSARVFKKRQLRTFYKETFLIFILGVFYVFIDWKWFCFLYLPAYYLGWCLIHLENYYEHYRATNPEDRFANSVSYYGKFYNWFCCNEAYHQEHHIEPFRHWRKRPLTRYKFKEEMQRSRAYVAHIPSLFGFLESIFGRRYSNG